MQTRLACVLCGRPVPLETANTDEQGKPVHAECYMEKIAPQLRFHVAVANELSQASLPCGKLDVSMS